MSSDWSKVFLSEVATIVGGGTPSTKDCSFWDGDIPWLTPKDLSGHHGMYVMRGERSISQAGLAGSSAKIVPSGTVLFTSRAPIGYVAIAGQPISTNQGFKSLVLKDGYDSRFFYYLLRHHTPEIEAIATGSTFMEVSGGVLGKFEVTIPDLIEQQRIAGILSCLDDRITLLRETNATLEAIAQALFKSWFVDFDPVHAKQQGIAPEGLDEASAALFPDGFDESELGLVPRGWRVGALADLAVYQNGYAFKTRDWQDTGHPVVKIGNVKPGIIDVSGCSYVSYDVAAGLGRFLLKRGDLLVGMTGYVGETGLVPDIEPSAYLNQRVGRISTTNGIDDLGFVYCLVRNPAYKTFAEVKSHGSAQANVSGSDLMSYPTVLPSSGVLGFFNQTTHRLIDKILTNHAQALTLAALRDTLLPRLISGQLRLPEAEEALEEAMA